MNSVAVIDKDQNYRTFLKGTLSKYKIKADFFKSFNDFKSSSSFQEKYIIILGSVSSTKEEEEFITEFIFSKPLSTFFKISKNNSFEEILRYLDFGVEHYLTKPININHSALKILNTKVKIDILFEGTCRLPSGELRNRIHLPKQIDTKLPFIPGSKAIFSYN